MEIKNIKGELYQFQKEAVEFLISKNGRGLLSLDMGLGKSFTSLAYTAHSNFTKIIVVSPASVKLAWENEVKQWTHLKPLMINSKTKLTIDEYDTHNIFILNYDILIKHFKFLTSFRFDSLIIDESTYIKNPRAKRTKAIKKMSKNISSVILLSGTPLLSRPIELFTTLNILDEDNWNNYFRYAYKFCKAWQSPWGLDVSGASNIPELREKLLTYMFRKRKDEVLFELPEKRFIDIPVELDYETNRNYRLLENSFVEYLRDIKNKKTSEIRKSLKAEQLVKLGELRRLTANGKVKPAEEIINSILESKQKVVVFSAFNEPLEILHEKFKDISVIITGSSTDVERQSAVDNFQNDDNIKIFYGGILSAGMGITLTAGQNVLFIDHSWTPASHHQSIDRIHRIGSKFNSISIYQLYAVGTIDEKMNEILNVKECIFNELIDGGSTPTKVETDYVNKVIKQYEKI